MSSVVNNLTLYDLVSGWIPCLAMLTGLVAWYEHHQCEEPTCRKLGHKHPDHGRPVCRDHYRTHQAP